MIIKNGNVLLDDGAIHKCDIMIKGDRIIKIGENLSGDEVKDAENLYVFPGLVDIHTHGGNGSDFMDASDKAFENVLDFHASNGTTSLLTSSLTASLDDINAMLGYTRKYINKDNPVCRVLGAHIEGPYISYKNKGAQNPIYLRVPARDSYDFILDNADIIKNVTISAELEGALEMTKKLKERGITVSCGHDDGQSDTLYPVIEAGMSLCTHWYCAMSTAQVRDGVRRVGLMEIGLVDDRVSLELLADNHHLTPELVKLAYKCKGAKKLCLVSDCLRAGGCPADGKIYKLGHEGTEDGLSFIVSDGVGRLTDGTRLAGSIQPIGQMIRNIVFDAAVPLEDAVRMASLTPAEMIGADKEIGSLTCGKKADIYIADKKLMHKCTITNGKIVKER